MTASDNRLWFHVILSAYGVWLPGDARGFRTRHHREHVEGDYKNPPPREKYAIRREYSRMALKHEKIILPSNLRSIVGKSLRERFEQLGAFVLCISVGGQHVHVLLKTPRDMVREWSGLAKLHAWHIVRREGWTSKLWAKRGKYKIIRSRQHQLNTYYYILDHLKEGAWIWRWRRDINKDDNSVTGPV